MRAPGTVVSRFLNTEPPTTTVGGVWGRQFSRGTRLIVPGVLWMEIELLERHCHIRENYLPPASNRLNLAIQESMA